MFPHVFCGRRTDINHKLSQQFLFQSRVQVRLNLRPIFVLASDQQRVKLVAMFQQQHRFSKHFEMLHHHILDMALAMAGFIALKSIAAAQIGRRAKLQVGLLRDLALL